jgi:hypothetical protein
MTSTTKVTKMVNAAMTKESAAISGRSNVPDSFARAEADQRSDPGQPVDLVDVDHGHQGGR